MHQAAVQRLCNACHDLSDGGLGVAVAEMCIGGRLGARIDLSSIPAPDGLRPLVLLYSESHSRLLVSVPQNKRALFEALLGGQEFACIGEVTDDGALTVSHDGAIYLEEPVDGLAKAFKETLRL